MTGHEPTVTTQPGTSLGRPPGSDPSSGAVPRSRPCVAEPGDAAHGVPAGATSEDATAGIRQIALDLLSRGIDELAEASTDRILDEVPSYGQADVSRPDLARETQRTLALTLHRLSGAQVPDDLASAAFETGRRRAEQGLPLASLLHAFRIDLRLLWDVIVREGRRLENLERLAILEQHALLWEALEANTADVVEAYRLVEDRRMQRLDLRDRELFKRFMSDGERKADAFEAFAGHSSLPTLGHYSTFVVTGSRDSRDLLRLLQGRLRASGHRSFVTVYKEDIHGLVLERAGAPVRADFFADAPFDGSVVAVRASDLSGVPRALRVARRVAMVRNSGSTANVGEQPLEQLAALQPEVVDAVLEDRLRALSALTAAETSGIWETIEALVAGDGSVADIAARTYRHRNTVRSRIERVRELTSLDSRVPSDLTVLALAVARRRATTKPAT